MGKLKVQTVTGPVVSLHSVNPTDDTARVYVGGVDAVTRDLMPEVRKVAGAALHTIVGAPISYVPGDGGVYVTIPAIRRRKAGEAAPAAPTAAPAAPAPSAPVAVDSPMADALARLGTMGLKPKHLRAVSDVFGPLVTAAATAAPAAAPRTAGGPAGKRAAAKASHACKVCADIGLVRKSPRENGSVAYITRKGAEASNGLGNATPCTAAGCKAGKAARKSA